MNFAKRRIIIGCWEELAKENRDWWFLKSPNLSNPRLLQSWAGSISWEGSISVAEGWKRPRVGNIWGHVQQTLWPRRRQTWNRRRTNSDRIWRFGVELPLCTMVERREMTYQRSLIWNHYWNPSDFGGQARQDLRPDRPRSFGTRLGLNMIFTWVNMWNSNLSNSQRHPI